MFLLYRLKLISTKAIQFLKSFSNNEPFFLNRESKIKIEILVNDKFLALGTAVDKLSKF